MAVEGPAEVLHGRRAEREVLERLFDAMRDGQSRVLVVAGEPGVGKTAFGCIQMPPIPVVMCTLRSRGGKPTSSCGCRSDSRRRG